MPFQFACWHVPKTHGNHLYAWLQVHPWHHCQLTNRKVRSTVFPLWCSVGHWHVVLGSCDVGWQPWWTTQHVFHIWWQLEAGWSFNVRSSNWFYHLMMSNDERSGNKSLIHLNIICSIYRHLCQDSSSRDVHGLCGAECHMATSTLGLERCEFQNMVTHQKFPLVQGGIPIPNH